MCRCVGSSLLWLLTLLASTTAALDKPDISWGDWIIIDDTVPADNGASILLRRITPKSVFVAPNFNNCPEGYRQDSLGRCVKHVQVNKQAQWNFFLEKLNSMYAPPPSKTNKDSGPFHINLPIGGSAVRERPPVRQTTISSTLTDTEIPSTEDLITTIKVDRDTSKIRPDVTVSTDQGIISTETTIDQETSDQITEETTKRTDQRTTNDEKTVQGTTDQETTKSDREPTKRTDQATTNGDETTVPGTTDQETTKRTDLGTTNGDQITVLGTTDQVAFKSDHETKRTDQGTTSDEIIVQGTTDQDTTKFDHETTKRTDQGTTNGDDETDQIRSDEETTQRTTDETINKTRINYETTVEESTKRSTVFDPDISTIQSTDSESTMREFETNLPEYNRKVVDTVSLKEDIDESETVKRPFIIIVQPNLETTTESADHVSETSLLDVATTAEPVMVKIPSVKCDLSVQVTQTKDVLGSNIDCEPVTLKPPSISIEPNSQVRFPESKPVPVRKTSSFVRFPEEGRWESRQPFRWPLSWEYQKHPDIMAWPPDRPASYHYSPQSSIHHTRSWSNSPPWHRRIIQRD